MIDFLIVGGHSKERTWLATNMLEGWVRDDPKDQSMFLHSGTNDAGELVLFNRSLHWVAGLSPIAAKAAALGLSYHLDSEAINLPLHDYLGSRINATSRIIWCLDRAESLPLKAMLTITLS